jgi:hypothetical protein
MSILCAYVCIYILYPKGIGKEFTVALCGNSFALNKYLHPQKAKMKWDWHKEIRIHQTRGDMRSDSYYSREDYVD